MYYRSNQTPQNRPNSGNQWGQYPPQGGRPGDYQNGDPGPRRRKRRGIGWQLFKLILVLLLVAAIGGGIYLGKAYLDVSPYTSTFMDGVSVDGINLSGMTREEGEAAVRNQIKNKLGSWYVRLKNSNGYYPDITAETLGISRDPSEALENAWAVGHETSETGLMAVLELQQKVAASRDATYSFSSVEYDADTSVIDNIMELLEEGAYIAPRDAQIDTFNPDNASEPFTFTKEVVGRMLDTETLKAQIMEMVSSFESGEIMLETIPLYPAFTVEDLQKYYTLRARAVTPIDKKSSEARDENIRVAFSKINGYTLNDGAKFSFNGIVGKRSQENGFYRAYEYNYGELVLGIGGGVCQASTTVYLAAMKAGMELIDHTAHSQKVSYTDLGMDATVSDTRGAEKDMSFRNNSGGQIFITARVTEDTANKNRLMCEVRIYGMDLGNTVYELETEIVEVLQPPLEPIYVEDTDADHVTYVWETEPLSDAAEGYVVDTYRITLENGTQIAREKLTRSRYPARAQKLWIGITPF